MSIDPFVSRFEAGRFPEKVGPLSSLTLAIKDNFDVTGTVTGSGHPLWAETHEPATSDAPVVQLLIEAGARPVGKTHMDELAFSLMGENAQYGTPLNPAAPGHVPGGSSSGSASAVAQGLADIGLGTDTGGSVRLPSSFCGLWGWRPTHGLLPGEGLQALAPSYDVPGILTRDGDTLRRVAEVLVTEDARQVLVPEQITFFAPSDVWALARPEARDALAVFLPEGVDGSPLFEEGTTATLQPIFRVAQGAEVAEVFGDWIREYDPQFGPGVRERFDGAMALTEDEISEVHAARQAIRERVRGRLGPNGVLLMPTAPAGAPRLETGGEEMNSYRNAALSMLAISGHSGLPQISVPCATLNGLPLGLSFVGPANTDLALIEIGDSLFSGYRSSIAGPGLVPN